MTINKYIHNFLKLYDNIKIDTNHVAEGSDKYGLYKSPGRNFTRDISGNADITENYQFYAMQKSISEAERLEDDEWLEEFVYWVDDYPLMNDYPSIDGGRIINDITVAGCPTPLTDTNNGIMYQISLSINYTREV